MADLSIKTNLTKNKLFFKTKRKKIETDAKSAANLRIDKTTSFDEFKTNVNFSVDEQILHQRSTRQWFMCG